MRCISQSISQNIPIHPKLVPNIPNPPSSHPGIPGTPTARSPPRSSSPPSAARPAAQHRPPPLLRRALGSRGGRESGCAPRPEMWNQKKHGKTHGKWHDMVVAPNGGEGLMVLSPKKTSTAFRDGSSIWVCLKIGYIPNYSHLIGIMITNHWVSGYTIFRQTHMENDMTWGISWHEMLSYAFCHGETWRNIWTSMVHWWYTRGVWLGG